MVNSSRALSTLLSFVLGLSPVFVCVPTATAAAGPAPAGANHDRSIAVVGLDSQDLRRGEALTDALRRAFTLRGYVGSEAVSLVEMRLTMGCEDDTPMCLAQAGRELGTRRLLYGYLRPSAGRGQFKLDLRLLDVNKEILEREISIPLTARELEPSELDATASRITAELLGEAPPVPRAEPPTQLEARRLEPLPATDAPPPPGDDSRYEWGRHRPVARWKWLGFGTSLGLTVVGAATAGSLTWAISRGGPVRAELLDAARGSLEDDKPSNDIDPNQPAGVDLCELARAEPPGEPGRVTNAAVTKVCNKADGLTIGTNVAWGVTAAAAVSTVVFTTLLFVRKRQPSSTAQRFSGDAGFIPGGAMLRGSLRF